MRSDAWLMLERVTSVAARLWIEMTKTRALCGIALLAALAFSGAVAMAQKPTLDPETFLPPHPPWRGATEKTPAPADHPVHPPT